MTRADVITSLVLIAFGAAVAFEASRMPRFEAIGGSFATAPGLVPGILGLIVAAFGVLMLARSVRKGMGAPRRTAGSPEPAEARLAAHEGRPADAAEAVTGPGGTAETDVAPSGGRTRLFAILGLSVLYAGGLVSRMPFWLATFLFVFVAIVFFEWRAEAAASRTRRTIVAAAIAGAVAYVVPFVFEQIFLVNLP